MSVRVFVIYMVFGICQTLQAGLWHAGLPRAIHRYPTLLHAEINFRNLRLITKAVDEMKERRVYFDGMRYYKIWDPGYPTAETFLTAVKLGYFDRIARIDYLIIDGSGTCRGYVAAAGKVAGRDLKTHYNEHSFKTLLSSSFQNSKYQTFYSLLQKSIAASEIIYFDLVVPNIITLGSRYYLIDLESVFTVKQLMDRFTKKREGFLCNFFHLPEDYQELITNKIKATYPQFEIKE